MFYFSLIIKWLSSWLKVGEIIRFGFQFKMNLQTLWIVHYFLMDTLEFLHWMKTYFDNLFVVDIIFIFSILE